MQKGAEKMKKDKIKIGQIVAVEMKYYNSDGVYVETRIVPGRVQKCCVHGVFIEDQIVGYDQILQADDIQIQEVLSAEGRVNAMLIAGDVLMANLIEPEFI